MIFILFLLCYLIGSFPTAYFVVKKFTGKDIRNEETGNVGAMNTARVTGKIQLFLLVMVIDVLKGYLGIYISHSIFGLDTTAMAVAGCGIVLGHCFSIYFKIKDGKFAGGKAIASLAGILIGVNFFHLFLPSLTEMLIVIAITRNFFAGQFFPTLFLPILGLMFPQYFLLTVVCSIPVLFKQWPRVIPMLQGKEPKMYFKKKITN